MLLLPQVSTGAVLHRSPPRQEICSPACKESHQPVKIVAGLLNPSTGRARAQTTLQYITTQEQQQKAEHSVQQTRPNTCGEPRMQVPVISTMAHDTPMAGRTCGQQLTDSDFKRQHKLPAACARLLDMSVALCTAYSTSRGRLLLRQLLPFSTAAGGGCGPAVSVAEGCTPAVAKIGCSSAAADGGGRAAAAAGCCFASRYCCCCSVPRSASHSQ